MPYPYQLEAYYEAKIEHLEKSHSELEAERDRLKADNPRMDLLIEMDRQNNELRARHAALVEKYAELLFAVGNKYPNESRHETALRYIRNAEKPTDNIAHQSALAEVKG